MSKTQQVNDYLELKQSTDRDSARLGVLTSDRYEADSTAAQTVINLSFSVTQTTEQKRGFQLYVDGNLLREGASNDFTFTAITSAVSSQVTLNAPIAAGLNIIALKVGGYQDLFPNPSSVTASLSSTNLQLDQKGNFNRAINGAMDFWQRGTSFAAAANATYSADRWKYGKVGATVATITRDTDVPTTAFGVYSLAHTVTTGSGAPAAGDVVRVEQFVEGNIFRTLKGKNIVCRFWVRSPVTGVHCVSFSNSANSRTMIKEYTVSVANTWEQKTIRLNHDTTGTWLYDTGIGMGVRFALMAGTNFQDVADTWITTNKYATVNQVNTCLTIGYAFKVTDVCMMEDNTALNSLPDFRLAGQDFRDELSLCQRYYEYLIIDGARGSRTEVSSPSTIGEGIQGHTAVTMRAIPVISGISVVKENHVVSTTYSASTLNIDAYGISWYSAHGDYRDASYRVIGNSYIRLDADF